MRQLQRPALAAGLVAAVWACASASADTLNVPGQYATIQAAIDAASTGDTVLVAAGSYQESIDFLGKRITVRSSSGAGSTTILDDSDYRVVFAHAEGPSSILDGFTITSLFESAGSGMLIEFASPTIRNCRFVGNDADVSGGAVDCTGSPSFTNCEFSGNTAMGNGGAVFVDGNPLFTACTFSGNVAIFGGAVYAACCSSNPTFDGCMFSQNVAGQSGGAAFSDSANMTMTDCTLVQNASTADGGALYVSGGAQVLNGCVFSSNNGDRGSAIYYNFVFSTTVMTGCLFELNEARNGGVYNMGAKPRFTDCTLDRNDALFRGGGIYNNNGSTPTIEGCTISGNTAGQLGGGVYSFDEASVPNVSDTWFCANSPDHIVGNWSDNGDNDFSDDCERVFCPEDFDQSGVVDFGDVIPVLVAWGPCEGCPEDLDDSGVVDFGDVIPILVAWGPCP